MPNRLLSLRRIVPIAFVLLAGILSSRANLLHDRALHLMQRLNAAALRYQNADSADPDFGGIRCPACGLCHTRAAEALLPLACEYRMTGDRERLSQSIRLGDWLLRQQQADGSWLETPETWTGTTTDQLLMLLLAYPIVEPSLTDAQRHSWMRGMESAADYLARVMDNRFASINYCATTTATLAEACRLLHKTAYAEKARSLARMIVSKMNAEWFIEGEGGRERGYKYGVDIGYNLEMSLWGLARYAQLTNDRFVAEAVRRSAEQHLWFIYPDGMLDASAGIRSNKWTVFGSGTSDGIHPLCALLCAGNPAFAEAALRNIECIEHSFTASGLLGPGPHYDRVKAAPPCIYPTFMKAKSLAMALLWMPAATVRAALPLDNDTCRHFRTLGITLVRRGPFCGTFTASTYKAREGAASKYMHRPAGGACSALWIEGFGLLQAASQTEYRRWEPMSFPEMPAVEPLTPRIETTTAAGRCTNLYEFDAWSETVETKDATLCTAGGLLRNSDGHPCGIGYVSTLRFEADRVVKQIEILHHTSDDTVRLVEPLLLDPETRIEQTSEHTLRITKHGRRIAMRVEGAGLRIDTLNAPKYKQIYPSLVALPIIIDVPVAEPQRREKIAVIFETTSNRIP